MTSMELISTKIKTDEPLGPQLATARIARGVSRSEAAAKTKIPERYVAFFEDGRHDAYADDVYAAIYLKGYAAYLGLAPAETIAAYRAERRAAGEAQERRHPTVSLPASHFMVTPTVIRNLVLAAAVAALGVYFGFEVKKIVSPPTLAITSPKDGLFTIERTASVSGRTEPDTEIKINGKLVTPDGGGSFADEFAIQDGMNIITIAAKKKYSRPRIETRRVIVMPQN